MRPRDFYLLYLRQRFLYLLVLCLVSVFTAWVLCVRDVGAFPESNWSTPTAITVKRIGELPDNSSGYATGNRDCSEISYRVVNTQAMTSGCFVSSAIGLVEAGGNKVIFNGTDEALPIIPYMHSQILIPWPGGGPLVSLSHVVTGGTRLGIYNNPLGVLRDNKALGVLVSKSITAPPSLIKGPSGENLDINPQTLAFSPNGEWLVAETLNGSFVRINPANWEVLPLAQSYGTANSDRLFESYISVSDDGQYVAVYNQYAEHFKVYDLDSCDGFLGSDVELPPLKCAYYDYFPFIKSQLPGMGAIRHVRFLNNGLVGLDVVTSSGLSQAGTYGLAPASSIGPLTNYLALGDSYTSGEGAFDYIGGTDTGTNKCHLSTWSYPFALAGEMGGGHSVACSGAVIKDIGGSKGYRGQATGAYGFASVLANYMPGYVPQHSFLAHYQPAITSVSVGGNDIGFGGLVRRCVSPHFGQNTCYSTYEDRFEVLQLIDRTVPRLISLYNQLQREAPLTRLYVIGYPQVADKNGDCALNVHLNRDELEFTEEIIDYLNNAVARAASKAGASYVDISRALYGHRLCEGSDVAVNGLTAGGHESYHPNALGHQLFGQAILAKTRDFTNFEMSSPPQNGTGQLLQVPHSGRDINNITPVSGMIGGTVAAGSYTSLGLEGTEAGLRPNTLYSVKLDGTTIASAITDDNAHVSAYVQIPSATPVGDHVVEVIGEDQSGKTAVVSQFIYVTEAGHEEGGPESGISVKINSLSVSG